MIVLGSRCRWSVASRVFTSTRRRSISSRLIPKTLCRIDTRYSELIGRDVKALNNLMNARVMDNRYHQLLYQEIAEPNLDKMRSIDADLDKTAAEFYSSTDEAKRHSPNLTPRIKPAEDLFDQVVSESRPVRGA